jgi:hypothetical protein
LAKRALGAAVAVLIVASGAGVAAHHGSTTRLAVAPATTTSTAVEPSTLPPPTTTTAVTVPPTTTTAAPPPAPTTTAAPKPKPKAAAPAPAATARADRLTTPAGLVPYTGLGTWSDTYDWSNFKTNGHPGTTAADVDQMVARGVQTLYIQASNYDYDAGDITDPDLLMPILRRAKERGLRVVAWYLPSLTDPQRDLQRMLAIAQLKDVDSVAVDIESRAVSDVNDRNARLVAFSQALRQALPGRTIGAIVLPPVVLEVINTAYWPNFPYRQIAPFYDVWMTMGYWTNRTQASGYRDAYRYTRENVDRLRADVGRADLPVHPIGGIGDKTTPADIDAYRRAAADTHALGGSLYDWRTTGADLWPGLQPLRT